MGLLQSSPHTVILSNPNANGNSIKMKESAATTNSETVENLEDEFTKTFQLSTDYLNNLSKAPCQKFCQDVINCIRENPEQLANCRSKVEEYRQCAYAACLMKILQQEESYSCLDRS